MCVFCFVLQETIAMTRLKRDLLHMTGNVNFYKSAGSYVVFRTDNGEQHSAKILNDAQGPVKKDESRA